MATALKQWVSSFILQSTQTDGVLTPHMLSMASVPSRSQHLTALPPPLKATSSILHG